MAIPDKFHLDIVTPERRVLARDVAEVVLPGAEGLFGVLPGHAPLLAQLGPGIATVKSDGRSELLVISGGFADVGPERVTVLAETCERPEEIDRARAEKKIAEYKSKLTATVAPEDVLLLQVKLLKQQARVTVTERL